MVQLGWKKGHMCHERLSHSTSVYLRLHLQPGCSHSAPPSPTPGPRGHKGSPDLQVQDHLSAVALVCVCLDAVDPGALEEMSGVDGGVVVVMAGSKLVSRGLAWGRGQQGVASPAHGFQPQQPT